MLKTYTLIFILIHSFLNAEVEEWKKAAEAGDSQAKADLAEAFLKGEGTSRDIKKAAQYAKESAESGIAKGQYLLGVMFGRGLGMVKDSIESRAWIRKLQSGLC